MEVIVLEAFGKDSRGHVLEYDFRGCHICLLVESKAGSVRGRHYHKGISPAKNPETLVLISGTCTLYWQAAGEAFRHSETVTAPAKIHIPRFTWHELHAVTDCSFIELNSLKEHSEDTFYDRDNFPDPVNQLPNL